MSELLIRNTFFNAEYHIKEKFEDLWAYKKRDKEWNRNINRFRHNID